MGLVNNILGQLSKHPIVSILAYTSAVYFASVSIVENKVLLAKAETETSKAETSVYKAKLEILEKEVDATRAENNQYKEWLMNSEQVSPIFYEKIKKLQKDNKDANELIASLRQDDVVMPGLLPIKTTSYEVARGQSITDEQYGVVIGVHAISITGNASLTISYVTPGLSTVEDNMIVGTVKTFHVGKVKCKLVINEINYVADKIQVTLSKAE
ncbi:hypothetical protein M2371_001147 [Buttiauxella sp. BIGb0471]|uniref:hypothetical protein n=1 Tax=Buttiauxella sp. BIGb0471 TaxID=2940597 RepID=UPI002169ED9D|nr:hypothetical protein [Buttiauxella sp. BIGb0471]MCS3601961.1 hypothetical protein [Buttiauxella sp. BIGb0471]